MSRKQIPYLNKQLLRALQLRSATNSDQSGFTLIESLLAIIVVAVLLTAVTPMLVFSVGTRLQARRVELATQAARAYVDGVRSGAIAAPKHIVVLSEVINPTTTRDFSSQRSALADAAPPPSASGLTCPNTTTGYPYCSNSATAPYSLYCIDNDGDGQCTDRSPKDFVVQAFRSVTATPANATEEQAQIDKGYLLGVRVYRADAFRDATALMSSAGCTGAVSTCTNNQKKQGTVTGGLGQRKAPLVVLTTEIVTDVTKFRDLCDRFGGCQ
jgi:prepilin-type N-terminal cleavage/methylation domain-containing protein